MKVFIETLLSISGKISGNLEFLFNTIYKTQLVLLNDENTVKYDTKSIYNYKKTKLYLNIKQNIKNYKKNWFFLF